MKFFLNAVCFWFFTHLADNAWRHHGRWLKYTLYALFFLGVALIDLIGERDEIAAKPRPTLEDPLRDPRDEIAAAKR